ncbi:AAA family ATPase [Providencia sp. PROV182]|uniref:AAA family ATPase n=1 Tax=Providencia sp. PROV182 TaxID=2949885 RepID=UPI00234ADD7C|nr:ATP-binding protein [Providencia sp. PROV182]
MHFLCGKIASGKSTLAKQLANLPRTILLCEDEWLTALYPNEINELAHYVEKSALVKQVLEDHIRQLIQAGNNIVMDFPANTPIQRQWLMSLAQSSDVSYVLQVSNDECKARLAARNLAGENPFQTSETQFDLITAHFSYPTSSERLICKFYP